MPDPQLQLLVEPLNGGLVTTRDPSLLQPGELQQADNACYKPNSQSLHKAPSRTVLVSNLGATVTGLKFCTFDFIRAKVNMVTGTPTVTAGTDFDFDGVSVGAKAVGEGAPANVTVSAKPGNTTVVLSANVTQTAGDVDFIFQADDVIVAQANGKYKRALAGTGALTFADVDTITEGDTLETVKYNNKHVLLNGVNDNRVLLADGSVRLHGLRPVKAAPNVVTAAGGAWGNPTGYYSYWTTEWDSVNDVESTFDGKPTVVNLSNAAWKATITRPGRVNASADKWRVYRSIKMAATTDEGSLKENIFPDGFLVGTMELKDDGTQITFVDGGTVASTASVNVGSVVSNQSRSGTTWTNSANVVGAADGVNTTCAYVATSTTCSLIVGTFNIPTGGITPPITGITLTVKAHKTGNAQLTVRPFVGLTTLQAKAKTVPLTGVTATYTLGGAQDTWFYFSGDQWDLSSLANARFKVELMAYVYGGTDAVHVDAVTCVVSYGKGIEAGDLTVFPAVTTKPFGIEIAVGKNGFPPRSTTGDMFQGSLVMNDVDNERFVRWTAPDLIDYVPSTYYLALPSGKVSNIKSLGNVLGVGMTDKVYRLSMLPTDVDTEFFPSRVYEEVDGSQGIIGTQAAARYFTPDGIQLAYASRFGPHSTDLYRVKPLSNDIVWEGLCDPDYLYRSIFSNNPERYELLFDYVPLGSGTPTILTKRLRFSYHPSHIKRDGSLKVSGPCDISIRSTALGTLRVTGQRPLWTGAGNGGTVNLENQGAENAMTWKHRQMYNSGVGKEARVKDIYVHTSLYDFSAASPGNITCTPTIDKWGQSARAGTVNAFAIPAYPSDGNVYPADRKLNKLTLSESAEALSLTFTMSNATHRLSADYVTLEILDSGRTNNP